MFKSIELQGGVPSNKFLEDNMGKCLNVCTSQVHLSGKYMLSLLHLQPFIFLPLNGEINSSCQFFETSITSYVMSACYASCMSCVLAISHYAQLLIYISLFTGLYDTVFDVDHDQERARAQGLEPNGFNFEGADFVGVDYALNR